MYSFLFCPGSYLCMLHTIGKLYNIYIANHNYNLHVTTLVVDYLLII